MVMCIAINLKSSLSIWMSRDYHICNLFGGDFNLTVCDFLSVCQI